MTLGCFRKQAVRKPSFKKLAVGRMLVTFSGKVLSLASGADGIYTPKLLSSLISEGLIPRRSAA